MRKQSFTIGNNRGIVLIDLLLTVSIVLMLIPAVMICLVRMQGTFSLNEEVQDSIAEAQLRHILLCASDKQPEGNALVFTYQDKTMRLSFVNDHLILQPGTQIFFSDTDSGSILVKGNLVFTVYTRGNHRYEKVIGTLS